MAAGQPRIQVKFLIDANGILHVSAREQRSGKQAEVEVQPSYGLTDDQVENMIIESFDCAEQDFAERQVIEARNEAETIVAALEKGRRSPAWERLAPDERTMIAKLEAVLTAVKSGNDYHAIRGAVGELNQGTMRLAELMMDDAVSGALKGKTFEQAGDKIGEGPEAPHPFAKAEVKS